MGGGTTTTNTQTSGLNNPELNTAISTIGSQLNTELGRGAAVFDQSLYPGLSQQTSGAVNALANNPVNTSYLNSVGNSIYDIGQIAQGSRYGTNAPGFQALRDNLSSDVAARTNSAFNASGRFGGGSNVKSVAEGIGNTLANLDYTNYQNDQNRQFQAAQMLPGLYSASLAPAGAQLTAGQITDADMLARRQGEADLFDRTQNAGWNTLARGTQILSGTAPSAGTTSTNTSSQQVPWWQTALGIAGTAAAFL